MRHFLAAAFAVTAIFGQGTVPTTGRWTEVAAHGPPIQMYGYDAVTWAPSITAGLIWGSYHSTISSEPNDALVGYSYAENRNFVLAAAPLMHNERYGGLGHAEGNQFYVDQEDSIYYTSDGSTSTGVDHHLGRMVQFDIAGLSQRDRTAAGTGQIAWDTSAGGGIFGCMAYDPSSEKALLVSNYLGKYGIWTRSTNVWAAGNASGYPSTTSFQTCSLNPDDHKIYVWGNLDARLRRYNAAMDTWELLTTTCTGADCASNANGSAPAARQGAFLAYSTADHVFLAGGGGTGPSSGAFADTWTFDPVALAWTELTPATNYAISSAISWARVYYDSVSNVFVLLASKSPGNYSDGSWSSYSTTVYVFPLSTALAYGRTANTYAPAAGSINVNAPSSSTQSWASDPSITTDGTLLYAGWRETGLYFDGTSCGANEHGYVRSNPGTGSTWTTLGSTCAALTPASLRSGSHLQTKVVGSTLWAAQVESTNSGGGNYPWAFAYSWSGSAWSGGQVGCQSAACSGAIEQIPSQLIDVGGVPTLAMQEYNITSDVGRLYVMQYSGGSWASVGGVALNHSTSAGSRVIGATITASGSNIYACWNESVNSARYTIATSPQVFCKLWNGSTWSAEIGGGTRNVSTTSWAGQPSALYAAGVLNVAWTERPQSGNPLLYAAQWDGATWTAGSSMNHTAGGWAVNPKLATDGAGGLWLAWEEQAAINAHSLGYVSALSGATWSAVGGAIATDLTAGSIEAIDLAVTSTPRPTVAYAEMSLGNLRQTYVKQWTGSAWIILGSTPPAITTTSLANGSTLAPYSASISTTGGPSPTCSITAGTFLGVTLSTGCAFSGTPTSPGWNTFTVTATNGGGSVTQAYVVNVTGSGPSGKISGGASASGSWIIH